MRQLNGIAALAPSYDGFILDLWGVVHNGLAPFPGAVDAMARLLDAGRRVVLLSNAPRRAESARIILRGMGITDDLYTGILTSGEAVHAALRDRAAAGADPWYAALGPRLFHIGPPRDRSVFEGLGFTEAATPEAADFVLNTGPDDAADPTDPAAFDSVLRACAAQALPMICANPDLEVMRGTQRLICAGTLAERYAAMGGAVRSMGKPDAAIYAPVLAMLGVPASRVLALGDSLRTDIAGAQAAGIDACWVMSGVHADDADPAATAGAAGLAPVAVVAEFRW